MSIFDNLSQKMVKCRGNVNVKAHGLSEQMETWWCAHINNNDNIPGK